MIGDSPIRVMLADDSPFLCRILSAQLARQNFDVVACVNEGKRVLPRLREQRPDAITLGLKFPDMDGLDVLAQIMLEHPLPVVVLTGTGGRFAFRVARALDLGAVDYVLKFVPGRPVDPEQLSRTIVKKLRAAAHTKVFRLRSLTEAAPSGQASAAGGPPQGIVVIGASTGGPGAIADLLRELPAAFPSAVLVVQHMPPKFTGALAARLDRTCQTPVSEARRGDVLAAACVKVAPGGFHLALGPGGRVALHPADGMSGHCPSVDTAMETASEVFGSKTVGVLLSGMGSDGVKGLRAIRNRGGATYVQSPETCAVPGMPGAALLEGLAGRVARPAEIGRMLARAVSLGERHVG